MSGSISRRCSCRNPETGKASGAACPKLSERNHGSWVVRQELPPREDQSRRQFRRYGLRSATAAQAELDKVRALLAIPDDDDAEARRLIGDLLESCATDRAPLPAYEEVLRRHRSRQVLNAKITVGEWLDTWIQRKRLRPTTLRRYESDIRNHLKPHLGTIQLDRLDVGHLDEMFAAIEEENFQIEESNLLRRKAIAELKHIRGRAERRAAKEAIASLPPFRRVTGLSSQHHIRRVLRASLNTAIARRLITFNPAQYVELPSAKRPKPVLWTDTRVAHWRATGRKPSSVMVWTPELTGRFLDSIAEERLYPLFHLLCFLGLRRGEVCGLRPMDIDWEQGTLSISTQLVQVGWNIAENAPKTDSGERTIVLDETALKLLKSHLAQQKREQLAAGPAWVASGRLFTTEDGDWLHPGMLTDFFERRVAKAGLPPVRLHDLRHGAATLAFAAGADLKMIQAMLGHSSITITADTYTSVLTDLSKTVANAAVNLVPRGATHRRT
jgi:integrase